MYNKIGRIKMILCAIVNKNYFKIAVKNGINLENSLVIRS